MPSWLRYIAAIVVFLGGLYLALVVGSNARGVQDTLVAIGILFITPWVMYLVGMQGLGRNVYGSRRRLRR